MKTENISTLKIHKLTQEQYERELEAGNIDETALYFTQDDFDEGELREFITSEDAAITLGYYTAIEEAKKSLNDSITAIEETANANKDDITRLNGNIASINEGVSDIQSNISDINTALEGKVDNKTISQWVNYDATNNTVEIGISDSAYDIKSSKASGLEIRKGTETITHWNDNGLNAANINASKKVLTPEVQISGLVLTGDSTNGWYFR